MKGDFHLRGSRRRRGNPRSSLHPCVRWSFVLALAAGAISVWAQTPLKTETDDRARYQIHLTIDFDKRTYIGTERVRFVNNGEHPTSGLFFHLYPNVRVPGYTAPAKSDSGATVSDEPRLDILE